MLAYYNNIRDVSENIRGLNDKHILRFLHKPIAFSIVIIAMFVSVNMQAQSVVENLTDTISLVNGKKYYLHTVLKGQTLYRISVSYQANIEEIRKENPALEDHGLQPDMILRIPISLPVEETAKEEEKPLPVDEIKVEEKRETVKAKDTLIYVVLPGETMYSITRSLQLTDLQLQMLNPELSKEGLKAGQHLIVPNGTRIPEANRLNITASNVSDTLRILFSLENIKVHTVERRETLYGISKEYGITIDELLFLNPDAKEGIKRGDVLKIPVFAEKGKQGALSALIAPPLDTILTDTIEKPTIRDKKSSYKVAMLIPFHVDDLVMTNLFEIHDDSDSDDPDTEQRNLIFYDYYEGALLAIDSIKKLGLGSLEIFTYDTREDSVTVSKILSKPEMLEMDLIIGPFFRSNLRQVAAFSKKHNIPHVSPVNPHNEILSGNNQVLKVIPSMDVQMDLLGKVVADSFATANIFIVYNERESDSIFAKIFYSSIKKNCPQCKLDYFCYSQKGLKGLEARFSADSTNFVAIISNNQVFVSNLVTMLNLRTDKYPLVVMGMPQWRAFSNIELEYLQKLNLHLFTNGFVDYKSPVVKDFLYKYHNRYFRDPGRYAFIGYDVTLYFLRNLLLHGPSFNMSKETERGTSLVFSFEKRENKAWENRFVNVYKLVNYQPVLIH